MPVTGRRKKSSAFSTLFSLKITAFSILCSNSRIFPGQLYFNSFSWAWLFSFRDRLSYFQAYFFRKKSARIRMSFPRLRSGGISIWMVLIRYSRSSRNNPFSTSSGRFLLVAQIRRISTGMGWLDPIRVISRFCSAASSLACRWNDRLPISSRNSYNFV